MTDPIQRAREITDRCRSAGFALAGVCEAAPSDYGPEFLAWLGAGKHGSMGYLARNVPARLDPRRLMPGARALIMVADVYADRSSPRASRPPDAAPAGPPRARVARYAQGDDYHAVMKRRLHALCDEWRSAHAGHEFRAFTDTAPVLEREHAARAGLGWIGRHTLLINPRLGSWIFLGGVLTTLELAPPPEQTPVDDCCGTCTRCIDACPTGAITPYSVDATRCISYLTIERREPLDPALAPRIGDRIFGCDVCQEVCPHNSARPGAQDPPPPQARPEYAPRREHLDPHAVLGWAGADRARELSRSAMKRATLDMLKRNARIVLDNAGPG